MIITLHDVTVGTQSGVTLGTSECTAIAVFGPSEKSSGQSIIFHRHKRLPSITMLQVTETFETDSHGAPRVTAPTREEWEDRIARALKILTGEE